MDIIGAKVKHLTKYGDGVIMKVTEDTVEILFAGDIVKQFGLNSDFDKYFYVYDDGVKRYIDELIIKNQNLKKLKSVEGKRNNVMTTDELKKILNNYLIGPTSRSYTKDSHMIDYDNDYLTVKRIDSSNHKIAENKYAKMWSIIYSPKPGYNGYQIMSLPGYRELSKIVDVDITPVSQGELTGCYGIRLRGLLKDKSYDKNMVREPNPTVIRQILDFIFS